MAEKQKNDLNEEQIVAFLQEIVGKIKTEEDPLELNTYRRLFRKAVPFTLRAYFAAYLLKQISDGKTPRLQAGSSRNDRSSKTNRRDRAERGDRNDRGDRTERTDRTERADRSEREERGGRSESRQREAREGRESRQDDSRRNRAAESRQSESAKPEPRPVLADDVSTTLFISIGRNRRVYPRDLIGLIMQNVEMEREHIGDIRVLDNYSFVQVITEDAEKIIAALNEFDYRGRKLAVSYSRKKDESSDSAESSESSEFSGSDSIESSSVPESDSFDESASGSDSSESASDFGSETDESDLENRKEHGADI